MRNNAVNPNDPRQRTYALVVGIDHYPGMTEAGWDLYGCVNDACRFVNWLVREQHVPAHHVDVLLSLKPRQSRPRLPRGVNLGRADEHRIKDYLLGLNGHPEYQGATLFLYWAGHGASRTDIRHVLCANFDPAGANCFGVNQLQNLLRSSPFDKQILIVDTCADHAENLSLPLAATPVPVPETNWRGDSLSAGFGARLGQQAHERWRNHDKSEKEGTFTSQLMDAFKKQASDPVWPPDMAAVATTVLADFETMYREGTAWQIPQFDIPGFIGSGKMGAGSRSRGGFAKADFRSAGQAESQILPPGLHLLCDRQAITATIETNIDARQKDRKPSLFIITGVEMDCPQSLAHRLERTRWVEGRGKPVTGRMAVFPDWPATKDVALSSEQLRAILVDRIHSAILEKSGQTIVPPKTQKLDALLNLQAVKKNNVIIIAHTLDLNNWGGLSQKLLKEYIQDWGELSPSHETAHFVVLFQCVLGSGQPLETLSLLFHRLRLSQDIPKAMYGHQKRADLFGHNKPCRLNLVKRKDLETLYQTYGIPCDTVALQQEFKVVFTLLGTARMNKVETYLEQKCSGSGA